MTAYADLHVYDPVTMTWTELSATASGTPPAARCKHGFAAAGGKLYVHGGEGAQGDGLRERRSKTTANFTKRPLQFLFGLVMALLLTIC